MAITVKLKCDADWLALNMYRMVLERIVERHEDEPWGFTGEEAAVLARMSLETFPVTKCDR